MVVHMSNDLEGEADGRFEEGDGAGDGEIDVSDAAAAKGPALEIFTTSKCTSLIREQDCYFIGPVGGMQEQTFSLSDCLGYSMTNNQYHIRFWLP